MINTAPLIVMIAPLITHFALLFKNKLLWFTSLSLFVIYNWLPAIDIILLQVYMIMFITINGRS